MKRLKNLKEQPFEYQYTKDGNKIHPIVPDDYEIRVGGIDGITFLILFISIIILLLIPSFAFAETFKTNSAARVKRDCKNWDKLEELPTKEAIRCIKSVLIQEGEKTQANSINIERIYDAF